jgi:CRP-like cAMP-binding protein
MRGAEVVREARTRAGLTQDELAGWVGSSREAVAKALRTLRDRRLLTTGRRTMTVLDMDGLRKRAGETSL